MPPAVDQPVVFYYTPQPRSDETLALALMQVIDASFLVMPGTTVARWSAIRGAST